MQKYIFILIAIVCLCLIVQPAIAYNPQELDTVDIYIPYFIQLIDSTASPYDTFWVKAGEIKTAKFLVDTIQANSAIDFYLLNSGGVGAYISSPAGYLCLGDSHAPSAALSIQKNSGSAAFKIRSDAANYFAMQQFRNDLDVLLYLYVYGSTASFGTFGISHVNWATITVQDADANGLMIGTEVGAGDLVFGTNDVERMRITEAGMTTIDSLNVTVMDTFDAYWDTLGQIDSCIYADSAVYAAFADSATVAVDAYKADSALIAGSAYVADSALIAGSAYAADSALISVTADSALIAASTYVADSAVNTGLLDGYSEDYFMDTNDTRIDSATYADTADTWDGYQFADYLNQGVRTTDSVQFATYEVNEDSDYVYIGDGCGSGTGKRNVFIGTWVGRNNTTGYDNVGIGERALDMNTTGYSNIVVGTRAMLYNKTGYNNFALGAGAMYQDSNTIGAIAIGYQALYHGGTNNIAIGYQAGYNLGSGASDGIYNTLIGYQAGRAGITHHYNTCIGFMAGYSLAGHGNTFIGNKAGYSNTGSSNIFIGYYAGYTLTAISNQLHIANIHTDSLIYGEFTNHYVWIKDSLGVSSIVTDKVYIGGGEQLVKFTKVGSHCAIVLNNDVDTFWIAADTTGF